MFKVIAPIIHLLKPKQLHIAGPLFKLQTKITVFIMVMFSLLLSAEEYFGKPIDCIISDDKNSLKHYVDNYCWTTGTYVFANTTVDSWIKPAGISDPKRIHLKYYQWTVIILFLQAALFYLPGYLWKYYERGLMADICSTGTSMFTSSDEWNRCKGRLLQYFSNRHTTKYHQMYAMRYFACEILNLIVALLNMAILHVFFLDFWTSYAAPVAALLSNNLEEWTRLNTVVFPKLAKCEFKKIGPSGSTELRDNLCFLPLNILNDKIFTFIYVWFLVLLVLATLSVLCSILAMVSKQHRISRLRALTLLAFTDNQMRRITNQANYGDAFVLRLLGRNLTSYLYLDLLTDLLAMSKSRRVSFYSEQEM